MAIKASIGIMLMRLTVMRTQRYILYANIALTQIYSFFFFFIFLFQCYPSSYFWERVGVEDVALSSHDGETHEHDANASLDGHVGNDEERFA